MKNNIAFLVFKKELKDIFRDRKTLTMSIILPLILFPIIFGVMGMSMNKTTKQLQNNIRISIKDDGHSELADFMKGQKDIKIIPSDNPEKDIKDGKLLLALEIPVGFDDKLKAETKTNVEIIYDNSSQQSQIAMGQVNSSIEAYSKQIVAKRLEIKNINPDILNPIIINTKTTEKESEGMGKFMLSLMLPLMIVIYSVTGPMAPAIDLGAGEKERGTLEPLLTTQAGRLSLLWGKFFAITVVGLMTTLATLIGLFISMKEKNGLFQGMQASGIGIDVKAVLLIGIAAALTTMVFGALELSISIYARSFKEAQTYVTPLTIISFIPAYATYMLDAKNIDMYYFSIPLANVVCLIKEFIAGIYNYSHIAITFTWILIYITGSILLARYMFSREEVIFRT